MFTAAQPVKSPAPLRVLLVGTKEEDFFLIRDILEPGHSGLAAELDHVHTLAEARELLQQKPYGLVLFEHETGNANAIRMVSEFHHKGTSIPFILLKRPTRAPLGTPLNPAPGTVSQSHVSMVRR